MPGFEQVIGEDEVVAYLRKVIKTDKAAQTYIFHGEDGSGKKLMAGLFAMALQCGGRGSGSDPCMHCPSCLKAAGGNHPDIITVTHAKPNLITVDEVRRQVVNDILIRPECSRRKIYILPEAEKMNEAAQNALLKTLEDLPGYAMIFLLTGSADSLLQTIRSRCVHIAMRPVQDHLIRNCLIKNHGLSEDEARLYTAYAQGNVGRALSAVTDEAFRERSLRMQDILAGTKMMSRETLNAGVSFLKEDREHIGQDLDLAMFWFRDVLLYKSTGGTERLIFGNRGEDIAARADLSSYEGLQRILEAIESARGRLKANVNYDMTAELLLSAMREN